MEPARYWITQEGNATCTLCPHNCSIAVSKVGLCRVRKNVDGKLYSLVYGKPVAVHVDPVEKKPLYHFLPGSRSLSIGTVGCNLFCLHCQNWDIARGEPEMASLEMAPEDIVRVAQEKGCSSISYTYNEPTVFHEFAVDCAKLARKAGLKNIIVTNGYISKEAAAEFAECMDAANVDLKAFDEGFYRDICNGHLQPVLDTLKIYKKKLWLEITNLIIDRHNDDMARIEEMCRWISSELGKDVPLHFSRAFPMYKMQDMQPTPLETLKRAKAIAEKHLDHVYLGNVDESSDTFCPKCKKRLISRSRYDISIGIKGGKCTCGNTISGVFKA